MVKPVVLQLLARHSFRVFHTGKAALKERLGSALVAAIRNCRLSI